MLSISPAVQIYLLPNKLLFIIFGNITSSQSDQLPVAKSTAQVSERSWVQIREYDKANDVICGTYLLKANKGLSVHTSLVAHQARAYPGFRNMKRLGVLLLPPEWDTSPLQGYPPAVIRRYPFIHLGGERHYGSKVSCTRTQCSGSN